MNDADHSSLKILATEPASFAFANSAARSCKARSRSRQSQLAASSQPTMIAAPTDRLQAAIATQSSLASTLQAVLAVKQSAQEADSSMAPAFSLLL